MDKVIKEKIKILRLSGQSYNKISSVIGLPVGTIKAYCSRNGIKPDKINSDPNKCKYCGKLLVQLNKKKPKLYCSDYCRYCWWSNNRDKRKSKGEKHICKFCGSGYESYNKNSKYCCHPCFINDRFLKGRNRRDKRTI